MMEKAGTVLIVIGGCFIGVAPDTIMDATFWARIGGMVVLMTGCFLSFGDF